MTNSYSEKQIREAFEQHYEATHGDEARPDDIMWLLTRPEYLFSDGEVGYHDGEYVVMGGSGPSRGSRPLLLSEMPAAVRELREVVSDVASMPEDYKNGPMPLIRACKRALAAFDQVIKDE